MAFVRDLRLALRSLRRRPGFALVALLTLALGTGVNVTLFGVLNRVVLRPLPFPDPDRLIALRAVLPGDDDLGLSPGDALELRRSFGAFASLGWVEKPSLSDAVVLTGEAPERIAGVWVSTDFFDVLGVRPFTGRLFEADEGRLGGPRVALLSHAAWRSRWGADAAVLGRTVPVNGEPVTVVGVLPPDLGIPVGGESPEIWLAMPYDARMLESRDAWITSVVARLPTGVTLTEARAELDAFGASVRERFPETHGSVRFAATSLHEYWVGDVRAPLQLLFGSALLVLLVACANLGILVAARNAARHGEVAVRRALGANRRQLARSILSESLMLGILGTALGVVFALAVGGVIDALSPVDLPRLDGGLVDLRFVLFVTLIATFVGLGVGLAPTVRALRTAPSSLLRARGSRGRAGFVRVLIAAESAVVLALVVAATLTSRGLLDLLASDPGFSPANRLIAQVSVPVDLTWRAAGGTERNLLFFREARDRLVSLPGIDAAGFVTNPPLTPAGWGGALSIYGEPASDPPSIDWEMASVGYFDAAGIDVIEGRAFADSDDAQAPLVAVVNETLARRFFPAGDALGRVISGSASDGPWRTIIGVVADVHQQSLGQLETRPQMYIHDAQGFAVDRRYAVLHARGDPLSQLESLRRVIGELEPGAALAGVQPMKDLVRRSAATPRFHAVVFGLFAAIAMALGLAGVFGVVSDALEHRRAEIAVRIALGAAPRTLLHSEIILGITPVLAGTVVGTGLTMMGVRIARGSITGLATLDASVFLTAAGALVLVSTLAVLGPALKAARIPPASALREQ